MTRAVLFGTAGVVVVGTAGFMAGRLSVTDLSVVPLVEPDYRTKVAQLEEWSVGPRPALSKAEWRQRFGDDVTLAARRVMEGLAATSYPDIEAIYNAHQFARNLSVEQIQEALAEAGNASRPEAAMAMEAALVNQWASLDGQGALTHVLARKDHHRDSLVHAGVTGWVRHDPEGARDWYQANSGSLKVSPYFGNLLDGIIYGSLARSDMSGAIAGVGELDAGRRDQVISAIAGQVYHDAGKRAEFLAQVQTLDDGAFLDSAREAVASSWSRYDPKAALEWELADAGSVAAREEVLVARFGAWLVSDEGSASDWLAGQADELQSDRVFGTAALALSGETPERALRWAEQIMDPGLRRQVLGEVYTGWVASEPDAAGQWLAEQGEETKSLLAGEEEDEVPPGGDSANAIVEALENELRMLENATGLTPDQIAAKREQLELLLNNLSPRESSPVDTEGE